MEYQAVKKSLNICTYCPCPLPKLLPPASHWPASGEPMQCGRETSHGHSGTVHRGSPCAGMEHLSPPGDRTPGPHEHQCKLMIHAICRAIDVVDVDWGCKLDSNYAYWSVFLCGKIYLSHKSHRNTFYVNPMQRHASTHMWVNNGLLPDGTKTSTAAKLISHC